MRLETRHFQRDPAAVHAQAALVRRCVERCKACPATGNNNGFERLSPRLDYVVNFTRVGTHYIWIRGRGSSTDDSVHVGLNSVGQATAERISGWGSTGWNWSGETMDELRAIINVTAPGDQVLNLWMREDGTQVDKIVLTTNPNLVPTSFGTTGPPESPRGTP